jgi:protoporphyrinogen oxidase
MSATQIVVLGAGPAGVGAAFRLSRRRDMRITVLERSGAIGGNAGSFDVEGLRVDYGSHRLHPSCHPLILSDLRQLLGDDLLERPRHGRIRLRGRWIHFPLKPVDLALRLPPSFILGVTSDLLRKAAWWRRRPCVDSFAAVLAAGLGSTICQEFYFPYARKIWGLPPEELAAAQARRRVSAGSLGKMLRKIAAGVKRPRGGHFFYPRHGYGQISDAYYRAARQAGVDIQLHARVLGVETHHNAVTGVHYEQGGRAHQVPADHVWSTIPITALAQMVRPSLPPESLRAADALVYRAMILVYIVLEQSRFSEYDAHYFPEPHVPISRLSEPKNYSGRQTPHDLTVLCAELPCGLDSAVWQLDDEGLGALVGEALERAGLPVRAPIKAVVTRRLPHAYPIYRRDYKVDLDRLEQQIDAIEGLLTFGRQGLFAHDNTHHALYTAYCAVDCLRADGTFDRERWRLHRREFEAHVVED